MYKCKICNKKCKTSSALSSHIKVHNYNNEKYVEEFGEYRDRKIKSNRCKVCDKSIPKHRIYCSNECKFSDKKYNEQRSKRTEKVKDSESKILECKECGKETTDVNNFSGFANTHLKEVHDIHTNNYLDFYVVKEKEEVEKLKCPYCEWETPDIDNKSGTFTVHLRETHKKTPKEVTEEYPELKRLWKLYFKRLETNKKQKSIVRKIKDNRKTKKKESDLLCKICEKYFSSRGLHTHLIDTHNITPDDYVKEYGEYRPEKLRIKEQKRLAQKNKINCKICGEMFGSNTSLTFHLKREHNLTKKEYILDYIFEGKHPTCKCGCGEKVKILNYEPYKRDYINGHNK